MTISSTTTSSTTSNVMYRVSSLLTTESHLSGWTTVLIVYEQCGCFYYFTSIDNACLAAKEFGTGIDVMPMCRSTTKSDDWYDRRDAV